MRRVALAARDFERPLIEEIGSGLVEQHERLIEYEGDFLPVWAQNIWLEPLRYEFKSISQAVQHLRSIQRNWSLHQTTQHGRAKLIQEGLPPIKAKQFEFMTPVPKSPLGAWTLLGENTMLYSAKCSSAFADGEVHFQENKVDPPSRAYLKLWELFTLEGVAPKAGEKVLDLGSSPGGWTWVLDQLGCQVVSVDKAPLAESVKWSPRVQYLSESAFGLAPEQVGQVDWLFSDIICYPERLLQLIQRWQDLAPRMVCTIKFQGPTNQDVVKYFAQIPGGRLRHLYQNKHELTWTKGL